MKDPERPNDELHSALDAKLAQVLAPPRVPVQFRAKLRGALVRSADSSLSDARSRLEREQRAALVELERNYVRLRRRTLGTMIGGAFAAGAAAAVALPWVTANLGPIAPLAIASGGSAVAHELGHDSEASADAQTALSLEERTPEWMLVFPPTACLAARYAEGAGLPDVADAMLATAGTFVDCASAKAEFAAHRGAWDDAQRDFAAAVDLAPSLPMAYESWGEALAAHHELSPAIEKYRAAHERGPHWADPLERWGEALAAQGQFKAAAQKYAEAFTYAPKWGALHLHRGEALDKLGDHAQALEQYRAAQELALSDSDKQMLAHDVATGSR